MLKDARDSALAKFQHTISAGDFLFRQGDRGNSIFVLTEGTVHLFRKAHGVERLVGTLTPGEILGEKALVRTTPYRHSVSAKATTEAQFLEFDAANFKKLIQTKIPDFSIKVIQMLSERLDEANALVSILQSTDEVERVVDYLVFFCETHSRKVPEGIELLVTTEDIQYAVNLGPERVRAILNDLVSQKILKAQAKGYLVSDKNALLSQISEIKERIAA